MHIYITFICNINTPTYTHMCNDAVLFVIMCIFMLCMYMYTYINSYI